MDKYQKREEFYKKHPEIDIKRIANMKRALRSSQERKEMSLAIKKKWRNEEYSKKSRKSAKLRYILNPSLREKMSIAMKKVFQEHPNLKKELRKNFFNWLKKNPESFMNSRGNPNLLDVKTLKQEYVRSTYEAKVADFLFINKIKYEYEAKVLIFKKEKGWAIPDFYLKKSKTYIEVLGGYPGSRTKTIWKRKVYHKYKIKCIFLTPALILNLDKSLMKGILEKT